LDARCTLAEVIGVDAEAIVYAYASCDRSQPAPSFDRAFIRDRFCAQAVPLKPAMVRQLAMLSCANELDVLAHAESMAPASVRAIARLLRQCQPLLPPIAASAVRAELDRLPPDAVQV
jgi:hypothetical protein